MAVRAQSTLASEIAVGTAVTVASIAAAVLTNHWTALLAPPAWAAITALSRATLPQRFAALAAATVLLPRYPLGLGLSVDDVIPSAAAITGVVLLARWGFPRLPRVVLVSFIVWIVAAVASAAVNGDSLNEMIRIAAPGVGRPVFWLVFVWTASAVSQRLSVRALLVPVAVVAIAEAVLSIAAYANCTEIHLGEVSRPDNPAVWESRRPLGVEQGAGTNVGEQRIRCRATGTLGQSSNFLAAFTVTTLPVAAGLALASQGKRRTWLALGTAAIFATTVLTFTRASLIAAAVAVLVMLLFAAPRRAVPVIAAGAVLIGLAAFAVPQIRTRLSDPANDRRALWVSGARIFADHPVFGVGFGRYREVQQSKERYAKTPYGEPTSTSHNGFIGIAAEGGAIQLGAVLVLAAVILRRGVRAARAVRGAPEAALVAGALGGAAGFLAQNMTNTLLLVPAVAVYFWVLGGALLGASDPSVSRGA